DGTISVTNPAGGLTSALQPLMESSGGTWVAWGSGSADFDVVNAQDEAEVPPDDPAYTLRRVRLTPQEVRSYYVESANRALWPLCHLQFNHFTFDQEHWEVYRKVNERFARAARKAAGDEPATVWIQDYHFGLAPRMLRKRNDTFVHQFWHIPWPPADVLRALPVARRLLRGLLGNDLLVFQTDRYVVNFLSSVAEFLGEAVVDLDNGTVGFQGHTTRVSAHAISIDVDNYEEVARSEAVVEAARRIRRTLAPRGRILLGVDRIDYSKGIPRRFNAFVRLLESRPDLRGKVTLVQVAVPSREAIGSYRALERSVVSMANKCNAKYGTERWKPVVLIRDNLDTVALAAHYRAADICLVSSLQDGM
ncbi:MAG: alpha,alpha-trehalose-phosphate synthase (UDP-forming), partial [Gemmatimonadales bacterium]